MGLRITRPAEPLSESLDEAVKLVSSSASRDFRQEMERYLLRESPGVSFLVSGARGSGKTTMVEAAVHNFLLEVRKKQQGDGRFLCWPLYVRLHGPSLFQSDAAVLTEIQRREEIRRGTKDADQGADTPGGTLLAPKSCDQQEAQVKSFRTQLLLEQIAHEVHEGAIDAFATSFRDRALEENKDLEGLPKAEALELAAQFRLYLDQVIVPDRLRWYWDRIGRLQEGVLFPVPAASAKDDQGMLEIVALAAVSEVNLRLNNTVTQKVFDKTSQASSRESKIDFQGTLKELTQPLLSLTAGALAWQASDSGLAGVLTGLGTLLTLRFSSSSKQTRDTHAETTILPDVSKESLMRHIPEMLKRLQRIGLMPIISIDELDKVSNLPELMDGVLTDLKQLVGQDAFFCFLTGKEYIEDRFKEKVRYGKEYTFFKREVYVSHEPERVREFLRTVTEEID